jgi:hypothetical protein
MANFILVLARITTSSYLRVNDESVQFTTYNRK